MSEIQWCYLEPSSDYFKGGYQSAEEAAHAAFEAHDADCQPGEVIDEVEVGQCVTLDIAKFVNVGGIVESITDNVFDEYEDCANEWCDKLNNVPKESLEELKGLVRNWVLSTVGEHGLFSVASIKTVHRDELEWEHMYEKRL